MKYRDKLKDPRWQKKRLGILERDGFACQMCYDTQTTLHVHHKYYNNRDPWDIPDSALVTLCATCHEEEGEAIKNALNMFKICMGDCGGMSGTIDQIIAAFTDTACSNAQLDDVEWTILTSYIDKILKDRLNTGPLWGSIMKQYFDKINTKCNTSE